MKRSYDDICEQNQERKKRRRISQDDDVDDVRVETEGLDGKQEDEEKEEEDLSDDDGDEDIRNLFFQTLTSLKDEKMNKDKLFDILGIWKRIWLQKTFEEKSNEHILDLASYLYPVEDSSGFLNQKLLTEGFELYTQCLTILRQRAKSLHLLSMDEKNNNNNERDQQEETAELLATFDDLQSSIINLYSVRLFMVRYRYMGTTNNAKFIPGPFENIEKTIGSTTEENDHVKKTPAEKYMAFLYLKCWQNQYCKRKELIYKPFYYNNQFTGFFEKAFGFKEFIYNAFLPREVHPEMHRCLTQGGTGSMCLTLLKNTNDPCLPTIERKNASWSWTNGVYVGMKDEFYKYENMPKFNNTSTVKFFEKKFDNDLYNQKLNQSYPENILEKSFCLETNIIDKILLDQHLSREVISWAYIFLGRLLFPGGHFDRWQVMPFFKGMAGTGKSLLLRIIQILYDPDDVCVISNMIEKGFGAQAMYQMSLILAFDIGPSFQLNQEEWQSMVSNEAVQVRIKNDVAVTVQKWTVPMAFSGNNLPRWNDNAGSFSRRLVIFEFLKLITNVDTTLFDQVRDNIPIIIKKLVISYLSAVEQYGLVGLGNVLPQEFHDATVRLRESTNALYAFCGSNHVIINDRASMPKDAFYTSFKKYCQLHQYQVRRLQKDYVCETFARFNIREISDHKVNDFDSVPRPYLFGCRLNEEIML